MVRVKICGITNIEDAFAAISLGADAIGFVFVKGSPRWISVEEARRISRALPPFVNKVGVFANEPLESLLTIMAYCSLDTCQLHGEEPPSYCEKLGWATIKAFRVGNPDEDLEKMMESYKEKVSAFLLDTYRPRILGGTGETFDWRIARELRKYGPIIISGGLNPSNVVEAIDMAYPYGVDVSSGVENWPGKKDWRKMKEFIERAKNPPRAL